MYLNITLQLLAATLTLPQAPFVDFLGLAIAIVSAILAIHLGINAAWLVAQGGSQKSKVKRNTA